MERNKVTGHISNNRERKWWNETIATIALKLTAEMRALPIAPLFLCTKGYKASW